MGIIYFIREIPVVDRAIETAASMLGSGRSRGYCLRHARTRLFSRPSVKKCHEHHPTKGTPLTYGPACVRGSAPAVRRRESWRCQLCGAMTDRKSITNDFPAILARTPSEISSPYVRRVTLRHIVGRLTNGTEVQWNAFIENLSARLVMI